MGILAKLHKRAGIVLQHDEIHTLKIVHEWWSHLCPPNMPNGAEWKCWGTIKMRNGQSPVPRAKMISANLVQGFRIYPWIAVPSFPQILLCFFSLALRPQPLRFLRHLETPGRSINRWPWQRKAKYKNKKNCCILFWEPLRDLKWVVLFVFPQVHLRQSTLLCSLLSFCFSALVYLWLLIWVHISSSLFIRICLEAF